MCNRRVVDDEGDVTADSRGDGYFVIQGDVEFHGDKTQRIEGGWVTDGGIDLARTARLRSFGEGESDAAIGAGNENNGIL